MDFGWNSPKLPGLGDVDWPSFFAMLTHPLHRACSIEVEDAAYEATLADRKRALIYRSVSCTTSLADPGAPTPAA